MEGFGVDRLSPAGETGRRIGLFFVGLSVAVFSAFLGFVALPVTDADPSPHNEAKWSALVDHPLLATPWVVAGLGVGVMAWTVLGRWSRAEKTERALSLGSDFATMPKFPGRSVG
jgi:hypothetical protein